MDLKIPYIIKPISLKDYAEGKGFPPEFDVDIWVWVNPRRELRLFFVNSIVSQKATDQEIAEWFAEMWSQGPPETHFTPEEVLTLFESCKEYEPGLWLWLSNQTSTLLFEHLGAKKKTSSTPPSS